MRLVDYLMNKSLYLGLRVEIANRFLTQDIKKKYNAKHKDTKIFDLCREGRITVEKVDSMVIARGEKSPKGPTGLVNFAVMSKINDQTEIERVVKIVNVLGNDRLIRERVNVFVDGKSLLNAIPELDQLRTALLSIETIMPGFVKAGWYYAPEAIIQ